MKFSASLPIIWRIHLLARVRPEFNLFNWSENILIKFNLLLIFVFICFLSHLFLNIQLQLIKANPTGRIRQCNANHASICFLLSSHRCLRPHPYLFAIPIIFNSFQLFRLIPLIFLLLFYRSALAPLFLEFNKSPPKPFLPWHLHLTESLLWLFRLPSRRHPLMHPFDY